MSTACGGWKVGKLSEMATIVGGELLQPKIIPILHLRHRDSLDNSKDYPDINIIISHGELILQRRFENSSAKIMPENTILMSSRAQ